MASDAELITRAVARVQRQVPKLAGLKLVVGLELTAGGLMGPEQADSFRIEVPGPEVSAQEADDARVELSIPRTMFTVLADEGELVDWREAYHYGHLRVRGDPRVIRLLGKVIGSA